jgi:hypothetical protein
MRWRRRSTRCSKPSLLRNRGPWRNIDDLEFTVAEYIDWFNHRRLHGEIGLVPPAELEDQPYRHHNASANVDASLQSLHEPGARQRLSSAILGGAGLSSLTKQAATNLAAAPFCSRRAPATRGDQPGKHDFVMGRGTTTPR